MAEKSLDDPRNPDRPNARKVELYLSDWQLDWLWKAVNGAAAAYLTQTKREVQQDRVRPSIAAITLADVERIREGLKQQLPTKMRRAVD